MSKVLGRKGQHKVGAHWVVDEPHIKQFERSCLSEHWQEALSKAPEGESISEPNENGKELYINITSGECFICPCSGSSFINTVYKLKG